MSICTKCRREQAVWKVQCKSFQGRFGVDCLFALKKIYRDKDGNWHKPGWKIERMQDAEETPKEFAQTSIRSRIEKAREHAKRKIGIWRRIQLECVARSSGLDALAGKPEPSAFIRFIAKILLKASYPIYQSEELTNELIARRFPGATIETEIK